MLRSVRLASIVLLARAVSAAANGDGPADRLGR